MPRIFISILSVLVLFVCSSNSLSNSPLIAEKWYYISTTFETWYDALSNCRSVGMRLLEINNEQENKQLQEFFKKRSYGNLKVNGFQILNYWTSGHNINRNNHWMWRSSDNNVRYTSWAPGQPDNNNYYGSEYCLELLYFTNDKLLWNDANCLLKKAYVCEN